MDIDFPGKIDYPDIGEDELLLDWKSIGGVYETLLPYPIDVDKNRVWKMKPKSPMADVAFTGTGTGFKPGMDIGPYNPDQLGGPEKNDMMMSEYDMLFVKQLLPDEDILQLFLEGTNQKRRLRENCAEERKMGSEFVEGKWEKYRRYSRMLDFNPELFQTFWAAKLGTLMYSPASIKELFGHGMFGHCSEGQFLEG